jgi:hypothetical protein
MPPLQVTLRLTAVHAVLPQGSPRDDCVADVQQLL